MARKILLAATAMLLSLVFAAGVYAAEVVQGKCLEFDSQNMVITLEEYDINFDDQNPYGHSTGIVSKYDVSDAKIGITPETNDVLRIAYTASGSTRHAIKVMNVSKQNLRTK